MTALLVNIDVDDLDAATAFYTRAFGLRVGRRFGDGGVELLGTTAPVYLLVKEAGTLPFPGATAPRDYGPHWTPVHLDFVVEDLPVAVRAAEAAGARVETPIREARWGDIALLRDPFGNGFCLLSFKGRGYDEIATPPGE
ncbi:VOC family protein [Myxococcaceae bacterium GXIMD 01537]